MICVSRPTNPTGNVITDEELMKLDRLANQHNIPLVIDNAYGVPFPGIIFSEARPEARPLWNPNRGAPAVEPQYYPMHEPLEAGAARFPLRDYHRQ
ncbi:Valine-pyruvate aminotransferase [Salmonella enterica subsp. enterica serovar Urbana str. R8-2977]|uniref:Valine-pyruvate aminotransferase n=1 Tax=Salmonella enterica subsp. enterica serovar Urbana str. R8-2977 TaxID=913084 RepID=G5S2J3_SALET|nr:Valine-pyruvate aminotransferase [Salmonella enterica subsp. enterica serovar Urbana str. R8-2977]